MIRLFVFVRWRGRRGMYNSNLAWQCLYRSPCRPWRSLNAAAGFGKTWCVTSITKAVRVHMLTVCLTVLVNHTTMILADSAVVFGQEKNRFVIFLCCWSSRLVSFFYFSKRKKIGHVTQLFLYWFFIVYKEGMGKMWKRDRERD